MALCEICGADCVERHSFRYPNSDNKDTTKLICKECHESVRVIINEHMNEVNTYGEKIDDHFPVVYPDIMNNKTTKYISYDDYKALEDKINAFVENGGV